MTIHDELVLELLKPKKNGKISRDAPIIEIIGDAKIEYKLEERLPFYPDAASKRVERTEYMVPDVLITNRDEKKVAIEVENDVGWDFGQSLRQVKKYLKKYDNTKIIIPKEYERFAPLYFNEGIEVHLWTAVRVWQCQTCGKKTESESKIQPKCLDCNKKTQHQLEGVKEVKFEPYQAY